MSIEELLGKLMSRKMAVGLFGIVALWRAGAPTWQIMAVTLIAVLVQGSLDLAKYSIKYRYEQKGVQK